jgi:sulfonate transport system ATP-binding protein
MLKLHELSKVYGTKTALAPTTLEFEPHSFTCIVGKSGCGKTTLLRLLGGLEEPTTGTIELPRDGSRLALVFQEPRLMPWLTVAENITFAAKSSAFAKTQSGTDAKNTTNAQNDPVLSKLLEQLDLTDAAKLYPSQLSGGMAQRVSLGRTLFYNPDIILMDEPFSALDYFTRHNLQQTLLKLYEEEQKTIIFVTHDVEEAVLLGTRILVMADGNIKANVPVTIPRPREASSTNVQTLRQQILQTL